mgnify:CR=1 FL=1
MADIAVRIEYAIQVWSEDDVFVAHAMPLQVMSAGETPEQAREAVDEAVRLFLQTARELGSLCTLLEEVGYAPQDGAWQSPAWVGQEASVASVRS